MEDDGGCEYVVQDKDGDDERYEGARKLTAFVMYGPKKASDDIGSVMSAVAETEAMLEGTRPQDSEKAYRDLPTFVRRYIGYSVDGNGIMHVHRKQNAFADNRAEAFVMLASEGVDWEQMMSSYDIRDWMEKTFEVLPMRTGQISRTVAA